MSPPGDDVYHAFLSYNRAADGKLAVGLQRGLQRFAKPWYRTRALRIFRDDASLSAQPSLWSSIVTALDRSRFFILLASPESGRSAWVGREVDYWCAQPERRPRLLIALTEGEIEWDSSAADFDWELTTALPDSLRGKLNDQPRYVDLRWARSPEALASNHPAFRDALADFAATLHGVAKDEIASEEVRQHRKTVRLTRGAVLGLVALTMAAIFFALFALQQRDSARKNARIERAGRLAALAVARSRKEPDLALLTAIEALRLHPSAEVRSAFARVLQDRGGRIAGWVGSSPLGFSVDGRFFGLYAPAGEVQVRRTKNATLVWRSRARSSFPPSYGANPAAASISSDGSRVALPFDDRVLVYGRSHTFDVSAAGHQSGAGRERDQVVASAFFRGNRRLVVVVARTNFGEQSVSRLRAETWDIANDRRIGTVVELSNPSQRRQWLNSVSLGVYPTSVSLSGDGRRVAVLSENGSVGVTDSQTGDVVADYFLGPGSISLDGDGGRIALRSDDGTVRLENVGSRHLVDTKSYAKAASGAMAITLSGNGERAVGWWVDEAAQPTQTYLQTWDVAALTAGGRWSREGYASPMIQPPRLDLEGTRLLAAPDAAFTGETVLYSPRPASVLAEGVSEHGIAKANDGIVGVGSRYSSAPTSVAGLRLLYDRTVAASVHSVAPTRGGARVVASRGDHSLEVIDLPSHQQRRLTAPAADARLGIETIYDAHANAVVGWDRLCHFCGLAQFYVWDASTGQRRGRTIGLSPIRTKASITWGGVLGATVLRTGDRSIVLAVVDVESRLRRAGLAFDRSEHGCRREPDPNTRSTFLVRPAGNQPARRQVRGDGLPGRCCDSRSGHRSHTRPTRSSEP